MAEATAETSGVVEVTLQHTPDGESVTLTSDRDTANNHDDARHHIAHVERVGEHTVIARDGERRSYVTHLVTDKLGTTTVWGRPRAACSPSSRHFT